METTVADNISCHVSFQFLEFSRLSKHVRTIKIILISITTKIIGLWAQSFTLLIYLWFYVAFNTVQVISRRLVGMAEETSTYSWSRFCTVNC